MRRPEWFAIGHTMLNAPVFVLSGRRRKSGGFGVPCQVIYSNDSSPVTCCGQWQWPIKVNSDAIEWVVGAHKRL